ncbi:MAG: hypothetical protein HY843_04930 [Bdellovibrio sp.]|nr:hypothetical protein [Bdellovibrio sp.]
MIIKSLQIICVTTVFFFVFQQVTYSDINSGDKKGKASTLSSSRADQSRSNPNDDSYRPVTPNGIKPPPIPALTLGQPVPSQ